MLIDGLRLLIISTFLLIATFSQAVNATPIIKVDAENLSSLDIGLVIGQKSKNLFADIESRYDQYLTDNFSQIAFDDIERNYLPALKSSIEPRYQKELEGVASAWTLVHENKLGDGYLSWDEYWILNLLSDVGLPIEGVGFGLSASLSKENGVIVGRNIEMKSTSGLRGLQAITVYQYAEHAAVVNIGFAGIISVMTGFNGKGLFVAHFTAGYGLSSQKTHGQGSNIEKNMQPHGFALRNILEKQKNTHNAAKELIKYRYGTSSSTLIADQEDIQVVEYSSSGRSEIRDWNSVTRNNKQWHRSLQIAVVNCHVLSNMPRNCTQAKDIYRWERLHSLAVFTEENRAGTQDIANIMLDSQNQYYEIMGEQTLQSMIFLPETGHLYLYAAPVDIVEIPPTYKIYRQEVMPAVLPDPRDKNRYFWWVAGLLFVLAAILWILKRAVGRKP